MTEPLNLRAAAYRRMLRCSKRGHRWIDDELGQHCGDCPMQIRAATIPLLTPAPAVTHSPAIRIEAQR